MAKKKHGGTRTVSHKEREERLIKEIGPFGPKRYFKENWVQILASAILMVAFCQIAKYFSPGDYLLPGVVAFVTVQIFLYFRARKADRAKEEYRKNTLKR